MTRASSLAASPRAAPASRWPGWRHLPRETRDTLFLLAVIAWVIAPHAMHLPLWCVGLALLMLVARAALAIKGEPMPPRWLLVVVLLTALGATYLSHGTLVGKDAGVTMVVVLMSMKTMELRARRDAFVVFFLGFFLVLTHFLYSQSLLLAASMLIAVWALLTAVVLAHMPVGRPSLSDAGRLALRMCLFGAPVMVVLFLLFPRFGPLWGLPEDATSGRTGLSNSMRIGSVAELALDDSVALRVRFLGAEPPPQALYFRGPVLADFDGYEWRPPRGSEWGLPHVPAALRVEGPAWRYEMTLEPTRVAVIPTLEATAQLPAFDGLQPRMRPDLQWVLPRPLMERHRIEAVAYPGFRHGPEQAVPGLREYMQLPPGHNPRTRAWAAALRRDPRYAQADADTLARAVLQHIRTAGFSYTLAPGVYGGKDGRDAIDEFWLDRRAGFCEHFAAAFVVVMRALDVPARVVTGYQGAERNPVDGYYLVRNSYAHAWAEYWQPGRGWVRADPTAAVAPDRIERTSALRPAPGLVQSALEAVNAQFWQSLRHRWEALNNAWNQWVLNYSRGQQLDLLRRLGFASPDWRDLAVVLLGLVVSAAAGGAAWAWWDRQRQDPWLRRYHRARRRLARAGLASPAHQPPRPLALAVLERWGPSAQPVADALLELEALRYAPRSGRPPTLATAVERRLLQAIARLPRVPLAPLSRAPNQPDPVS
ncbi:MAG TPA: transglutaminaseTgpA domain-containing protein [Burkholderiaceae bacterium]|nr:transglutaminaseTgpA domain-containing protein [Burkholderiaceae bacterium]